MPSYLAVLACGGALPGLAGVSASGGAACHGGELAQRQASDLLCAQHDVVVALQHLLHLGAHDGVHTQVGQRLGGGHRLGILDA